MARYGKWSLRVLGVTTLLATSGCELQKCEGTDGKSAVCVKSLTRYEADAIEPDAVPYAPGTDVSVHGVYGNIRAVEGNAGEVRLKLEPFDYRAYDAESAARDELAHEFDYGFGTNETGIYVQTGRHDSANGLGADITLYLPPEFAGRLALVDHGDGPVDPGNVEADFIGATTTLTLTTMHLGDCTANGAPSDSTHATCNGNVVLKNFSNRASIATTGLDGNVTIDIAEIGGSGGGEVSTEDGDIAMTFPKDGLFHVVAVASGGTVNAPELEAACAFEAQPDHSNEYSCGGDPGGPTYRLTSGLDGVGPSNISLGF